MSEPNRHSQPNRPLTGVVVALSENRELDRMVALLEAEGATTYRCPLVALVDPPDFVRVDAWLSELIQPGFDDLIFLTGEGLRRLAARARTLGRFAELRAALVRARKITRGGKPARALHELGLAPDLPVSPPTSQGVIETLRTQSLAGRRIGVQLYDSDANSPLVDFLVQAGAVVSTVAPYVPAAATDAGRVGELIHALARGSIDALAFTSAGQVRRLWSVADGFGLARELAAGLARVRVAAMGPVVQEALRSHGVRVDIVPTRGFALKRLTDAIAAQLAPSARRCPGEK